MIKQSVSVLIVDDDDDDDDDDENEDEHDEEEEAEQKTTLHSLTIKGCLLICSSHLGAVCFTPVLPARPRSVPMKFQKLPTAATGLNVGSQRNSCITCSLCTI